jgi:hypothetical protein
MLTAQSAETRFLPVSKRPSVFLTSYLVASNHVCSSECCQFDTIPVSWQMGGIGTIGDMSRKTATFSISLPREMMEELELVRMKEHRTRSEQVREALRRYFRICANPNMNFPMTYP